MQKLSFGFTCMLLVMNMHSCLADSVELKLLSDDDDNVMYRTLTRAEPLAQQMWNVSAACQVGPCALDVKGMIRPHIFWHNITNTTYKFYAVHQVANDPGIYYSIFDMPISGMNQTTIDLSQATSSVKLVNYGAHPALHVIRDFENEPVVLVYEDTYALEGLGQQNGSKIVIVQYNSIEDLANNNTADYLEKPNSFNSFNEGTPSFWYMAFDFDEFLISKSYLVIQFNYQNDTNDSELIKAAQATYSGFEEDGGNWYSYERKAPTSQDIDRDYSFITGSLHFFEFADQYFLLGETIKNTQQLNENVTYKEQVLMLYDIGYDSQIPLYEIPITLPMPFSGLRNFTSPSLKKAQVQKEDPLEDPTWVMTFTHREQSNGCNPKWNEQFCNEDGRTMFFTFKLTEEGYKNWAPITSVRDLAKRAMLIAFVVVEMVISLLRMIFFNFTG